MTAANKRGRLGGLLVVFALAACVSPDRLQLSDGGGKSFTVRGKSYEQVWRAAMVAMGNDMQIVESHKPSGVIKSRVGAAPTGKVVAFFIQPTTPAAEYTVTIVSRKFLHTDFVDRDWEPSVVEDFRAALNMK
jgi:hypothetical protein